MPRRFLERKNKMSTGSGLSIITQNNKNSYNVAVNTINKHQRENVSKLERALVVANSNNDKLSEAC